MSQPHSFSQASSSFLIPLAGPQIEPIELKPAPGGLVVGRHDQCNICLPAGAEKVSRFHARFDHDGDRWRVTDLGSRWGTFVNGVRMAAQVSMPIADGDLIRISPWTFTFSPTLRAHGIQTDDDVKTTIVRTEPAQGAQRPLAETMLAPLLEGASAIHAASDEVQLAELLIDVSIRGTGLQNAAVLRPMDSSGTVKLIASRFSPQASSGGFTFSRSLLAAASAGVVAEIGGNSIGDISHSIVQLRISSAICVPVMLGNTVAAFLYLDSRQVSSKGLHPQSSAFCAALGRIASLALANLKRVEMERREAVLRAELEAAAAAQKWILPQRQGRFGPFVTIGESRPGQYVGGDFFDIIPLGEKRLAFAVADVCGKGMAASMLMTATQGFLHAALTSSHDLAGVVNDINRFVHPRRPEGKFVTLWAGCFDAEANVLRYIDAGHGYALLQHADGNIEQLCQGGGLPLGVDSMAQYEAVSVPIRAGDKLIVVSDGIVEQFGRIEGEEPGEKHKQFALEGIREALSHQCEDEIANLFAAVIRHAGTNQLNDDATAILVKWA